ncbi:Vi polysaccharide biosynthesis protein VipB/TviC [Paraburkholderia ginsengiterrae]|uniref:Vi polysaccharide biosynthesis protein VipB/TviC n=1 Tax=Paraburkholderia ginsengiterrae TaxID=1462993 RepID=A0A1A9MZK1_9BURK|nr:SDR family oxidoreductase [Paraburkholderia ginsengiterrae]OAJ53710.1 Vi polysaccharide biosynthesis protein VipB/TviC [Paraburkholderia ginsengiterrae]OAJ54728.1 Vi polysaccharide biosynthesis protein VipB/TviC [Paraburkholderia ginsengiterrae]
MKSKYEEACDELKANPKHWLVTGVAGFIGSNLAEQLLRLGQRVTGLDNFLTGSRSNIHYLLQEAGPDARERFTFEEGDIRNIECCRDVVEGVDHILHQAALGSVPRSMKDPLTTNDINITGFLNVLIAAREKGSCSFTYAASSSTYGDHPALPKREASIGMPLSPYAVTKYVDELYAHVFAQQLGFRSRGLRYFNVFGKRQDPDGAYAAVIPRWIMKALRGETIEINGDGSTSRDFCFVENVIQANILSAMTPPAEGHEVCNIALGDRTTLLELYELIVQAVRSKGFTPRSAPVFRDFRAGDVRHSQADISRAIEVLGYSPSIRVGDGLQSTVDWYASHWLER